MKLKFNSLIALMLLVFGFSFLVFYPQTAGAVTRDLVFDDEEDDTKISDKAKDAGISNPEVISVKTTFDLTKDGETTSVPMSHDFNSGDKLKLRYTTNADGYTYWLAKMSSGKYSVLFPTPDTGMDNSVKKNENYSVPSKGYFKFDDNPGKEQILLIFSQTKIPELETAVAESAKKAGEVAENASKIASLEKKTAEKRTTRDLVFDDEEDDAVSTKTQAGASGEPFVAVYDLNHK
jgi:hypothetical protein